MNSPTPEQSTDNQNNTPPSDVSEPTEETTKEETVEEDPIEPGNNIILIGFMGAGKTTIGKELAYKLNYGFIDTDSLIEQFSGKSIEDIFATHGEESFRQKETELLKNFIKKEHFVICAGGGLPLLDSNWEIMQQAGHIIYLQAGPHEIMRRIKMSPNDNRPLLKKANLSLENIERLLNPRIPIYEKAHYEVCTDNATADNVVTQIQTYLFSK